MSHVNETGHLFSLLKEGCNHAKAYHNLPKAHDFFINAKSCAEKIYGKRSNVRNIINLFDYLWDEFHGEYRTAILKLADAGELLEQFREQDATDEFTTWIYENKEALMDEAVAATYTLFKRLGFDISIENLSIQALLCKNDMEELMNRTLVGPLGLPRRFHYLIHQLCKGAESPTPDMSHKAAEMLIALKDMEGLDIESLDENEKKST